jgi:bis(5'-nucleosidyl)-tetraphosphatase
MTRTTAPSIGDRSYGIIPLRFLPSISDHETAIPTTKNTQVLLIHQKTVREKTMSSFWCFPKGHAEKWDLSIKHTAVRELEEETNLKVLVEDLIIFHREGKIEGERGGDGDEQEVVLSEMYVNPVRKVGKEVRYWPAVVKGEQDIRVQTKELEGAEWMDWELALERITFDEAKTMLREVMMLMRERELDTL